MLNWPWLLTYELQNLISLFLREDEGYPKHMTPPVWLLLVRRHNKTEEENYVLFGQVKFAQAEVWRVLYWGIDYMF